MRTQINFADAQQALGFIMPQFYNVERTVYENRYPSFDYGALIPVVTEGDPWGRGVLFRSTDSAGKGEFLNGKGFDMPFADVSRNQFLKGFELAGIGYEWSLEELSVAASEGRQLGDEKARAAQRIAEQMLWNIVMTGAAEKNWTGLVNDGAVPATTAAATGTGSSPLWSAKTPDLILEDMNAALTGVITGTAETEEADTILLPTARFNKLAATPRSTGSDTSILAFLRESNVYTARSGQPLMIRALRGLETAGASAAARMVAYRRDPEVLKFHLPMPHRFLPPFQKSSMTWEVGGIMRTGGTEIRRPKSMSYIDGI